MSVNSMGTPEYEDVALEMIRNYCRWHVCPKKTETLTIDGGTGSIIQLRTKRIIEVAKVIDSGSDVTSSVEWSEAGILRKAGGFNNRLRGVQVTLTHGYDLSELPDVVPIIGQLKSRLQTPVGSVRSQTAGPYSVSYATVGGLPVGGAMLLATEKAILDRYRLVWGP